MLLSLDERIIEKHTGVVKEGLPKAVLCRVTYPICNIGKRNANGRVYEREVWDLVLKNPKVLERLEKRCMFGQDEHPQGVQGSNRDTSHVMSKIWIDEATNRVMADFDVLDTPAGRIINTMLEANCNVGVSTRAKGELEEAKDSEGAFQRVIPTKYDFGTVDFTNDPSTFNAYPEKIQREMVDFVKTGVESKSIDLKYAASVLESIPSKEAKVLLETVNKQLTPELTETKKLIEEKEKLSNEIKEARNSLAIVEAERDKTYQLLEEEKASNAALEESYVKDVKEHTSRIEELNKQKVDLEAQLVESVQKEKELTEQIAKLKEGFDAKLAEEKKKIEEAVRGEVLKEYKTRFMKFYGLEKVLEMEKPRALLEQASTFEEIEKLIESLKEQARDGMLHFSAPAGITLKIKEGSEKKAVNEQQQSIMKSVL